MTQLNDSNARTEACAFIVNRAASVRAHSDRSVITHQHAFTMIEVMLSIALLTILLGVIGVGFFGRASDRYLDEGSRQFETTLRMMRAEAATQGRRFRLSFNAESGRVLVQWEPQPLAQPNEFLDYTDSVWVELLPHDYVRVLSVQRTGDSAVDTLLYGSGDSASMGEDAVTQYIDFYPDGTCDSAVIQLSSSDAGDLRRTVVRVDGISQQFVAQVMSLEEVAAFFEQMGLVNTVETNAQ
ncbi:MAG: type II secretion system protein [Phycisphaeraceae bacterium]